MASPASMPAPNRRGLIFFLLANVAALVLCVTIGAVVWYGDPLDVAATAAWAFLARHSAWAVGAALSPLLATLLVGYGYMRRGLTRRSRERALAATNQLPQA